jgi:tripartite ATP-independent transporter DctP family solute receptor
VLSKRGFGAFMTAAILLASTGCSGQAQKAGQAEAGGTVVLRLADISPTQSLRYETLDRFAQSAGKKSGGKLEIKVFPGGQLGGERDTVEAVSMGTVDMTAGSTTLLSTLEPKLGIVDLPFLWRDTEHTHKVMKGEVGTELANGLQKKNIHVLAWMDLGSRILMTRDRTVKSLSDFNGLKIRVPESEVYVKTFKLLGANPTPMPWGEIYTSLQTKVVEAVEAPPDSMYTTKFQEVAKKGTLTWHMWTGLGLVVNEAKFGKLSPDLQKALLEAAQEAADWNNSEALKRQDEAVKQMTAAGVEFSEIDRASLQKVVEPLWKEIGDKLGASDLVAKIQAVK